MTGNTKLIHAIAVADRPNGATHVRVNGATHGCCSGVPDGVIISLYSLLWQPLDFGARAPEPRRYRPVATRASIMSVRAAFRESDRQHQETAVSGLEVAEPRTTPLSHPRLMEPVKHVPRSSPLRLPVQ